MLSKNVEDMCITLPVQGSWDLLSMDESGEKDEDAWHTPVTQCLSKDQLIALANLPTKDPPCASDADEDSSSSSSDSESDGDGSDLGTPLFVPAVSGCLVWQQGGMACYVGVFEDPDSMQCFILRADGSWHRWPVDWDAVRETLGSFQASRAVDLGPMEYLQVLELQLCFKLLSARQSFVAFRQGQHVWPLRYQLRHV